MIQTIESGLPADANSKWRNYKRYCIAASKHVWVVSVYPDFYFPSAVDHLAAFLSYRRDTGTGSWADVTNHRSVICSAWSTVFSCPSPAEDPLIKRLVAAVKKIHPPQPRHPVDEPAWDPSVIIDYWLGQPGNDELPLRELALKSWSLWAIATFPRPSDGSKLVRSTLVRHEATGALKFRYFGTKELKLPVFSVELAVHPDVQKKICAVVAIEAYLSRTSGPAFKHGDRVWCSLTSGKNGCHHAVGPETLSRWMSWIMTRSGVPAHFTGGSVRMAAASKKLDDGWDPRAVLMMGRWRSWHVLDAFYNRAGCRVLPQATRQVG